jgi:Flp pilus assembly protein TadG
MRYASATDRRSESGAILIQVATALLVFTMLSAFVVDYGVQLVSRNQIQNAADAAALAGATALAFDSYSDRTGTGPAASTAQAVAAKNLVWSDPAIVDVDPNVVCASTWEPGASGAPILACVKATAYRTGGRDNPIPTFFGKLMGVQSFGVWATATGEAKDANATGCLKPLAIPDRWVEHFPAPPAPWSADSHFDRWDPDAPAVLLPVPEQDSYIAPDQLGGGTGLTITDNFGRVRLKAGSIDSPIANIKPWLYLPVQIPGSTFGPNDVYDNTFSCAASKVTFGTSIAPTSLQFVPGGVAANAGQIALALGDLVNRDPGAHWNAGAQRVEDSCADAPVRCASMSPRIIAIATYDPLDLAIASHGAGATSVLVTNIVGFFVESVAGTDVIGYITRHPGLRDPGAITLFDASSFLRASMLVQ